MQVRAQGASNKVRVLLCSKHRKLNCQRWASLLRLWRVGPQATHKTVDLSNLLGDSNRALQPNFSFVFIYKT